MLKQDDYIRVLMTKRDKALIEEAALCLGETLSSFVRRKMRHAAKKALREAA